MKTKKAVLRATAAIIAVLGAQAADAAVNAKCYNEWNAALVVAEVGEKCKFLDAATADQLKAAESSRMQCALAKATAAEKGDFNSKVSAVQADSAKRAAAMDCGAGTRKVFDANITRLKKAPR